MSLHFRFAIASDLHVALPETIPESTQRFHLVEVSIPVLDKVLEHLSTVDLDFLLVPGDLTQDGEPENHTWLQQRLEQLPYTVYVIPGNHDIPSASGSDRAIAPRDFPNYYRRCGYDRAGTPDALYYTCELLPGVQLVALNSNLFDADGKQYGRLDREQLNWLRQLLPALRDRLAIVAIHHNVIEHVPGQGQHPLSRRYMLENADELKQILRENGVKLVCTGHLHVQDIALEGELCDIVTGSLVSYPHPYRIIDVCHDDRGMVLEVDSHRVAAVPGWEDLQERSRECLGDRSFPFMQRLLAGVSLDLDADATDAIARHLRYFWADIAAGDARFEFPDFPPAARRYFERFSADACPAYVGDNRATLVL
ncbi:putative phosphohydrolase [Rubidibacter lacunae KORDI 51-2]|uniref:Putative phosphohydrolase n=1 Tax=Rubidibacter lacunae KORDI 51-2 TaxID=582515 RepID=U5DNL7_9CHRO|nr:metallophosphoesterase [Rubidibacter lacunae]ERN42199.1 putative phosphohydrolase [Rubidibacter lacunae KORDI 51-2]